MATARSTTSRFGNRRRAVGFAAQFAELLRMLKSLHDPYRPERHYMRGPGPKWHAKHDPAPAPNSRSGAPGRLLRVKA
jgi:hypothetical protein